MRTVLGILGGAAAGALAMYFLDPQLGRRRRMQVRDRSVALVHDAGDFPAHARAARAIGCAG